MSRPTQQDLQAEELQLIEDLLATLRAKPRRTAAVLSDYPGASAAVH